MKLNKLVGLLIAVALILSCFAGCGNSATEAVSTDPATESVAEQVEAPEVDDEEAPEADIDDSAEDVEEVSAEEEVAEPAYVVEYPCGNGETLTMVSKLDRNMQGIIENFSEVYALQVYEERTGVNIEFKMLGDSVFYEQLNLLITANDLPDMVQSGMAGYSTKLSQAIEDEILLDIQPYLAEYAPDYYAVLQNDQSFADNLYNDDGTISCFNGVSIPTVDAGMTIRGDWLEALNLETPSTISELTEVLRAFHSEYNTTLTLLVGSDLGTGLESSFNTVQSGFDGIAMQLTAPDSGVVVSGFESEGYIAYLDFLHDLYAEGLFTDDYTGVSMRLGTTTTNIKSGNAGVWNGPNRTLDPADYDADDPNYAPKAMALPTLDDGERTHVLGPGTSVGRGSVYITFACEKPELACSFMNYAYTEEGITLCSFGVEGETFQWIDSENVEYTGKMTADPELADKDAEVLYLVSNWMPTIQTEAMFNLKNNVPQVREAAVLWTETSGDDSMDMPDAVSLNAEDTETFNNLAADIVTMFSERAGMYVMGNITRDDFLAAIEDAKAMGLDEITEIYQAAYDSYIAKN